MNIFTEDTFLDIIPENAKRAETVIHEGER